MLHLISDWSQALSKFLREQLGKILEHHQGSSGSGGSLGAPQTSFLTAGSTSMVDIDSAMKHWNYCTQLAKHLYDVSSGEGKESKMATVRERWGSL